MIQAPINVTLPATGATADAISLGSGQNCRKVWVQTQGDVDCLISNVQAMTTYWTIKSGTRMEISQFLGRGATLFYAKSSGAEDVIEIFIEQQ